MRGFSITLVFGSYGGFHVRLSGTLWRICLGWVALTIYFRHDMEYVFQSLLEQKKRFKKIAAMPEGLERERALSNEFPQPAKPTPDALHNCMNCGDFKKYHFHFDGRGDGRCTTLGCDCTEFK